MLPSADYKLHAKNCSRLVKECVHVDVVRTGTKKRTCRHPLGGKMLMDFLHCIPGDQIPYFETVDMHAASSQMHEP
jgi:hypothetical protein